MRNYVESDEDIIIGDKESAKQSEMNKDFAEEVKIGLTSTPKTLPSKYFYDDHGSVLFQQIMRMPEYYLTDAEYNILEEHKASLLSLFSEGVSSFDLIEFGAGDGVKTKILLSHFSHKQVDFRYRPVDISQSALDQLTSSLQVQLPSLSVEGIHDDYFKALGDLEKKPNARNVLLFMGANIGNYNHEMARTFLRSVYDQLHAGDLVTIGFDLKKDPRIIRTAYDDPHGITKSFNLNVLNHINRELDADFDLNKFDHYEMYDPMSGEARSFLYALEDQEVEIKACNKRFFFAQWEMINTEISKKYSLQEIDELAIECGFEVMDNFFDQNKYFVDSVWRVK